MSTPISVACANCKATMKAPASAAGRQGKCPRCGEAITVPDPWWVDPVIKDPKPGLATTQAEPPSLPVAEQDPRPNTARRQMRYSIMALSGLCVFLLVCCVVLLRNAAHSTPTPVPFSSAPTTPPPNPAIKAKESFSALVDGVRLKLPAVADEELPAAKVFDWDMKSSSQLTMKTFLGPDSSGPIQYDVQETTSLVTPYRGVITFRVNLKSRLFGVYESESQARDLPFPTRTSNRIAVLVEQNARGEAEYRYSDGRWSIVELRVTPTTSSVTSEESAEKNLFSALMASELNKNPKQFTGRTTKLDPNISLALAKVFREAASS